MHSALHTRTILKQIKADRRVELREIPGRWSNPDCEVGVKFSGMKLIGANSIRNIQKPEAMKDYKDHLCSGNPPRPQQLLDHRHLAPGALSVALDVRAPGSWSRRSATPPSRDIRRCSATSPWMGRRGDGMHWDAPWVPSEKNMVGCGSTQETIRKIRLGMLDHKLMHNWWFFPHLEPFLQWWQNNWSWHPETPIVLSLKDFKGHVPQLELRDIPQLAAAGHNCHSQPRDGSTTATQITTKATRMERTSDLGEDTKRGRSWNEGIPRIPPSFPPEFSIISIIFWRGTIPCSNFFWEFRIWERSDFDWGDEAGPDVYGKINDGMIRLVRKTWSGQAIFRTSSD